MQLRTSMTGGSIRSLRHILALAPCGKPQATCMRPHDGSAAVAAGARQLHRPPALRRLVGAYPCALVCATLSLRAPGRGRLGDGASAVTVGTAHRGCQLRAQEWSQALGHRLVLERHGPCRPVGVGGYAAGRRGRGGRRRCVSPRRGAIPRRATHSACAPRSGTVGLRFRPARP